MDDKEINIKLAQFAGSEPRMLWRYFWNEERDSGPCGFFSKARAQESREQDVPWLTKREIAEITPIEEYEDWSHIPNYCQCLSEMRDFEEDSLRQVVEEFISLLEEKCKEDGCHIAFATARQRAECAVRALGL